MLWRTVIALYIIIQSFLVFAVRDTAHFDIRVTSVEDVMRFKTTYVFENPEIKDYNNIEVYWKDESVYVSAPNNVLKLSYKKSLSLMERYRWRPKRNDVEICKKKGRQDCDNNHIKILLLFNSTLSRRADAVFMCGTLGRKPKCTERSTRNMTEPLKFWGGEYRSPYNPKSSVTALMASDGFLYLGTVTDSGDKQFSILRRNQSRGSDKPELFTRHNDDRYLMDPVFVSSHEIGDYVYFFFHETSYESYTSCNRKIIVSRVARVCKRDPGSGPSNRQWTTYLKARMVCTQPSSPEGAYNQIASTYFDSQNQYIYAVFTSNTNGPAGSLLCRYPLSALEEVFKSKYFVQNRNRRQEWFEEENKGLMACPGPRDHNRHARTALSSMYQMVSQTFSNNLYPTLLRDGERWTKVVETNLRRRPGRRRPIIFIATNVGTILKVAKIKKAFCIVEIIEVERGSTIKDLVLVTVRSTGRSYLIAAATTKIVRLGLHRCERFKTSSLCIGARDPYCGWDTRMKACVSMVGVPRKSGRYRQDLSDCPDPSLKLDGSWSAWGAWGSCEQKQPRRRHRRGLECRCRLRDCSKPPAILGGKPCKGPAIQVTNCTVDGGWSSWSAWSGCSRTCGYSQQFRVRHCDSPSPSLDGRPCQGKNEWSRSCPMPMCPMPTPVPVHGSWSAWSEWSGCTVPCGTGFRKRSRSCSNPAPRNDGYPCYGASWEYSKCNKLTCPKRQKSSEWTSWTKNGPEKDSTKTRMIRYRFICSAPVPDERLLTTKLISKQQVCDPSNKCFDVSTTSPEKSTEVLGINVDGSWSSWSEWSPCSMSCGGGSSRRFRKCNSPTPRGRGRDCLEKAVDVRLCNVGPCDGGQWTCWSDWSRCDCSNRVRMRDRHCRTSEGLVAIDCPGLHQDTGECDLSRCISGGWMHWTVWSVCRGGQQVRTRQCRHDVPRNSKTEYCHGRNEEQRSCKQPLIGGNQRFNDQFGYLTLVIVGVACLLFGVGITGVSIGCYCLRKVRRLEHTLESYRSRSMPANPSDTLSRSVGISDLPPPHVSQMESDSFLPWQQRHPSRPSLDRQHSFHGTTTTSLGRQYSNTSSVRGGAGVKMDNCAGWLTPMDNSVLAYTTFRRPVLNLRRPSSPEVPSRYPAWENTLPRSRVMTRSEAEEQAAALMMPVNSRRRLETNASEHDSVFTSGVITPSNETRQLLASSRYRTGD